ncbi:MAG: hypothetical protein LBI34_00630 [Puniceicoccales bacterium]|nr:hypothetical protein [Puniceicoccales bacterium]
MYNTIESNPVISAILGQKVITSIVVAASLLTSITTGTFYFGAFVLPRMLSFATPALLPTFTISCAIFVISSMALIYSCFIFKCPVSSAESQPPGAQTDIKHEPVESVPKDSNDNLSSVLDEPPVISEELPAAQEEPAPENPSSPDPSVPEPAPLVPDPPASVEKPSNSWEIPSRIRVYEGSLPLNGSKIDAAWEAIPLSDIHPWLSEGSNTRESAEQIAEELIQLAKENHMNQLGGKFDSCINKIYPSFSALFPEEAPFSKLPDDSISPNDELPLSILITLMNRNRIDIIWCIFEFHKNTPRNGRRLLDFINASGIHLLKGKIFFRFFCALANCDAAIPGRSDILCQLFHFFRRPMPLAECIIRHCPDAVVVAIRNYAAQSRTRYARLAMRICQEKALEEYYQSVEQANERKKVEEIARQILAEGPKSPAIEELKKFPPQIAAAVLDWIHDLPGGGVVVICCILRITGPEIGGMILDGMDKSLCADIVAMLVCLYDQYAIPYLQYLTTNSFFKMLLMLDKGCDKNLFEIFKDAKSLKIFLMSNLAEWVDHSANLARSIFQMLSIAVSNGILAESDLIEVFCSFEERKIRQNIYLSIGAMNIDKKIKQSVCAAVLKGEDVNRFFCVRSADSDS